MQRVFLVGMVLLLGVFLRLYHFDDWLLFKGDAFRDAVLVSHVIEDGWVSLPLLGPRAGGTWLHLGPIFYYFQSFSAWLFSDTHPAVLAYPDFLFSILALPMMFVFSRRYFDFWWATGMTALLSVSFLAVEYGRFAWNPNATPFFVLAFLYALLRWYDGENTQRKRLLWAGVTGLTLGIASQLHFSAFLGLPIVFLVFVAIERKLFRRAWSLQTVIAFFSVLLFLYTPVLAYEWLTGGENTAQFFQAIASKGGDSVGFIASITETTIIFSHAFLRISLGLLDGSMMQYVFALGLMVVGFLANMWLFAIETDAKKRRFLLMTLIFLAVFFLLYLPLGAKVDRARFFLPLLFVPYVFIGYIFSALKNLQYHRLAIWLGGVLVGVVLGANLWADYRWFEELRDAQVTASSTDDVTATIKGRDYQWTWAHFSRAAELQDRMCQEETIVFMMSREAQEYDLSIEYALMQRETGKHILAEKKYSSPGQAGCYFFISRPGGVLPPHLTTLHTGETFDLGGIQVIRWYPVDAVEAWIEEPEKQETLKRRIAKHGRLFWGDVFVRP